MDSFASAAEKITAAGSRLQEEAERESRYWEQISRLKAKGWAVSRLPRNSRAVGVHFGFAEAAPSFRKRGFAILRRDQDGNVSLDHSVIPPQPLAVVVTVSMGGQGSGSSAVQHPLATEDNMVEHQILQAHKTLSEEELFHEINREGRLLANQGVEISATAIKFGIGDETMVQLRLINPETESAPANSNASAEEMANVIALSLRILLAYAHQQNLHRRSNAPPPMTLKAKGIPEYALLRPVMSHLQHNSHLDALRAFTASVIPPLLNAGLNVGVRFSTLNHWNLPPTCEVSPLHASDLLQPLTAPLESTMTLELPTKRSLELTIRTFLGNPLYGTDFGVKALSYGTKTLSPPRLETVAEIEAFVCHVLMIDIAMSIEALHATSEQIMKKDHKAEAGTALPAQPSWRLSDIHHGELSQRKFPGSIEKLQVRVWRDRLGLRYLSNVRIASGDIVPYIWEANKFWKSTASGRQEEAPKQLLAEVVRVASQGTI
jgi:mediator of RNA polymerase II transcription subunit 17